MFGVKWREVWMRNKFNGDQLWNTVKGIWDDLSRRPLYWQGLSNSMVSRLELARQVNGDWTKY